jgi:sugar/nucleoside kinase (ribokinase family)
MEPSLKNRLLQKLEDLQGKELSQFHIVLLPDFFVDHFVSLDTVEKTCAKIKTIATQGGGNLPGITQRIHQGGNAANTALGLARLGMNAHLICQTTPFGLHLLEYFLGKHGVDLSGVKTDGKLAITTALEFREHSANIMIGDAGSVAMFRFDLLNDHDLELISSANLVGVTNWNLNRYGTGLACKVFERAKKWKVRTFFDSGDPSPRLADVPDLIAQVLMNPHLDIFGLNENELNYYSKRVNKTQDEMIAAVESLQRKIHARIDFHTSLFSCSVHPTSTVVPTIPLSAIYRMTGAGDAWNAANLFADLLGFADDERLLFANIFAGQYISSSDGIPLTTGTVINFIKKSL